MNISLKLLFFIKSYSYASIRIRIVTHIINAHGDIIAYVDTRSTDQFTCSQSFTTRLIMSLPKRTSACEYYWQIRWPLAPLKSCLVASEFEQIYRAIARWHLPATSNYLIRVFLSLSSSSSPDFTRSFGESLWVISFFTV